MSLPPRDHGGGLDAAIDRWGGTRAEWLDLSTGINPSPYPVPSLPPDCWTALPDRAAQAALTDAARAFWQVPQGAMVLAAPGASALIAKLPTLTAAPQVAIPGPTYNEHAAAFAAHGVAVKDTWESASTPRVLVHPNNPDGRMWRPDDLAGANALTVIDESFCDITPSRSLVAQAPRPNVVVLKSFGKFWGLAGLRLGFAIGHPATIEPLLDALGPWPVSGPALAIGAAALRDTAWATATRARLAQDAGRFDALMAAHGALVGGSDLFRLYDVGDAAAFQARLAEHHIWSRIFPYSDRWIRLGLPAPDRWSHLETAL